MTSNDIPPPLVSLFESDDPLAESMRVIGECLECDRSILFLREPESKYACMTHTWNRKADFELQWGNGWQPESPTLADDDPLFAEALRNPSALFIEDIETAGAQILDADYERENFHHRALIHAPLYHEGLMWGIFEPSVFGAPRTWTDSDRAITTWLQKKLAPLAARYVARHCRL